MEKSAVFDTLKEKGFVRAEVEFSGGNDEGGVDDIRLFPKEGKAQSVNPYGERYNPETRKYEEDTSAPISKEVIDALSDPVYASYGSFAGEFHVYGTVTWDVEARTAKMGGQESVETYNSFETDVG